MPYDRAEFDEFWQDWLDINRTAQRIGDWTVMAGRAAIGKPTRALPVLGCHERSALAGAADPRLDHRPTHERARHG